MVDVIRHSVMQRLSGFAQLFLCAVAITLVHRAIGIALHFKRINFKDTYDPYAGFNQFEAYLLQFKETIANGIKADLLFCFLIGSFLFVIPRSFRYVVFALLALFYAGNLEHIRYNMTSFDIALMGMGVDTTFILAQVTKQFVAFFVVLVISVIFVRAFQLVRFGRLCSVAVTLVAVPLSIIPLYSIDISQPSWMQNHPLLPDMRSASISADNREFKDAPLRQSGSEFYNSGIPKKNVLLVYLEGLSYLSMEKGDMRYLQSLANKSISYERFFGHQLITVNGLYSTLTGRLPRFVNTDLRWDEIDGENAKLLEDTLPTRLKRFGYQTAFIQSAPLSFMSKSEILPYFGFDTLIGDEKHPASQPRGGWGVDDSSLFDNVVSYIDSLDEERPWMIGVLTTGTHSPYFVPDEFLPEVDNDRYRALNYADKAIEKLISSLEDRGLLEDTVIVITADESRETTGLGSLQDEIALNWLPLMILAPDVSASSNSDYTVNSELPRMIWTLLDENPNYLPMQKNEEIVFGNIISGRVIRYDIAGSKLFVCENQEFACGLYGGVTDLAELNGIESIKQAYFPKLKQQVLGYD